MPAAVEVKLNVQSTGTQAVDELTKALTAVGASTKLTAGEMNLLQAVAQSMLASGTSLGTVLEQLASSTKGLGGNITALIQEILAAIAAADNFNNANKKLGDTLGSHTVPQVAAASAAIRAFEGQLPIRAVERFAISTLGLGTVLQGIFPIVGAVASLEVIGRLAEKFDPLTAAVKRTADQLKEVNSEFARLAKQQERNLFDQVNKTLGRAAGYRFEAGLAGTDVAEIDASIATKKKEIARRSAEYEAYTVGPLAGAVISTTLGALGTVGGFAAGGPVGALAAGSAGVTLANSTAAFANNRIRGSSAVENQGLEAELDLLYQRRAEAVDRGKARLDDAQHVDDKKGAGAQKKIDEETIALRNELAALQIKELSGLDAINAKYDATIEHLREQKKLNTENVALVGQIRDEAVGQFLNKSLSDALLGKHTRGADRTASIDDLIRTSGEDDLPTRRGDQGKLVDKGAQTLEDSFLKYLGTGYPRELQQQDNVQIGGIRSTAAHRQRIAGIQSTDPTQTASDDRAIGLQAIADEAKVIAAHQELYKLDVERARLNKESSDVQLQYEERLAQIRQQSLTEYKQFFVGLTNASFSGGDGITKFLEGFGHQIADKVVGNVAGLTFDTVRGALPNIPGQKNAAGGLSTLGKVLQGTPLATHSADPVISSQTRLTVSTDSLKISVDTLTAALRGGSAGAGGAGGTASGIGALQGALSGYEGSDSYGTGALSSDPGSGEAPEYEGTTPTVGGEQSDSSDSPSGSGIVGKAGAGLAIGAGALTAYKGFSKGGAKGITQGISGVLGTAAGIASLIPGGQIVGLALGVASGVTSLIGGLLGDSKAKFAEQQDKILQQGQYVAPTSTNSVVDTHGDLTDYDSQGHLRTSPFDANTINNGYLDRLHGTNTWLNIPGYSTPDLDSANSTLNPLRNPAGQQGGALTIQLTVQALDTKSILDRSPDIAMAISKELGNGSPLGLQIQQKVLGS